MARSAIILFMSTSCNREHCNTLPKEVTLIFLIITLAYNLEVVLLVQLNVFWGVKKVGDVVDAQNHILLDSVEAQQLLCIPPN